MDIRSWRFFLDDSCADCRLRLLVFSSTWEAMILSILRSMTGGSELSSKVDDVVRFRGRVETR